MFATDEFTARRSVFQKNLKNTDRLLWIDYGISMDDTSLRHVVAVIGLGTVSYFRVSRKVLIGTSSAGILIHQNQLHKRHFLLTHGLTNL